MNETLKCTLDMIRSVSKNHGMKIDRDFTNFLADRLVQATTQPSLLSMLEHLTARLNTQLEFVKGEKIVAFMQRANADDAPAVLNWLRENPRSVTMIVMQKKEEDYEACLKDLEGISAVSTQEKGTALQAAPHNISIKLTCLSPLAHGAEVKPGNATIFRRMQVLSTTGQVLSLPFYAGNAFRGQLRDVLADHFLRMLGLTPNKTDPPCHLWFFHALYAGGVLEENSEQAKALSKKMGSSGTVRAEGIHEFRNMIPPLSLLGTALGNRIISGRVNICDFRPVCKEWNNGGTIPVRELFDWLYLTRREDHESHPADEKSSAMIVNTECLKAGVVLQGGIDLSDHITDLEASCLGMGLQLLQQTGYVGGENRRGFGRVLIEIEHALDATLYETYLTQNRSKILSYLEEIGGINAPGELNFSSPA